jgi:hypothetical protein
VVDLVSRSVNGHDAAAAFSVRRIFYHLSEACIVYVRDIHCPDLADPRFVPDPDGESMVTA